MRMEFLVGTTDEWKVYTIREYLLDWTSSRRLFAGGATTANQCTAIHHFEQFLENKGSMMEWTLDKLTPIHIRQF